MKTLKNWKSFNESLNTTRDDADIAYILQQIAKDSKSSKQALELKDIIKQIKTNEGVANEGILTNLKNWIDDKLFKYLINRKASFYTKLLDKLNIFDLTTLDDTFKNYPGFTKLHSMYLAGGYG